MIDKLGQARCYTVKNVSTTYGKLFWYDKL